MSDRFRSEYAPLTADNKQRIADIKASAAGLEALLLRGSVPASRELSLALTKLEESVMWATKHFSAPERQ